MAAPVATQPGLGPALNAMRLPVALAVVALVLAFSPGYLWNEDLGWYLASGERILDEGAVPAHDDLLYSHGGAAGWIAHSWAWTVVLAVLNRAFGPTGLALFNALALLALLLPLLFWIRLDRCGLLGGLAAVAVLVIGGSRLLLRAELASWLFLLAYLVILERRRASRWTPLVLAALQLAWANTHGGFLLGLFVVAAYAVGGRIAGDERRVALWTVPLLAAVSLLKPGGVLPELQRVGYGLTAASASPVMEWRPAWLQWDTREPWVLAAVCAIGLASFLRVESPKRWSRLLLLMATTAAGFAAVRFVVAAVLCAAVVTLLNLRDRRSPAPRGTGRPARIACAAAVVAFCGVVGTLAFALARARHDLEAGQSRGFVTLGPASTAPGAADYILAHELPAPLFNDMELGGYLEQRLYPRYRAFIDSRNLSLELLHGYVRIVTSRRAWRNAEAEFGFRTVVLSHLGLPSSLQLRANLRDDPHWLRVYVDPQAVIFVRVDDATAPEATIDVRGGAAPAVPYLARGASWSRALRRVATRLMLRLDSDELMVHYFSVLGDLGELAPLIDLTSDALDQRPDDLGLLRIRGMSRVFTDRFRLAASDLERVVRARPDDADAQYLYAVTLARLGRTAEAAFVLDRLLERFPDHSGAREMRDQIEAAQ